MSLLGSRSPLDEPSLSGVFKSKLVVWRRGKFCIRTDPCPCLMGVEMLGLGVGILMWREEEAGYPRIGSRTCLDFMSQSHDDAPWGDI